MKRLTHYDKCNTAIHEAGHALAALALGVPVERIHVLSHKERAEEGDRRIGYMRHYQGWLDWARNHLTPKIYRCYIAISAGGPIAEYKEGCVTDFASFHAHAGEGEGDSEDFTGLLGCYKSDARKHKAIGDRIIKKVNAIVHCQKGNAFLFECANQIQKRRNKWTLNAAQLIAIYEKTVGPYKEMKWR
jgi:hypothetical protein